MSEKDNDPTFEPEKYSSIPEMMLDWATNTTLKVYEERVNDKGEVIKVGPRNLTVAERARAANIGGDFFNPKLKAIESKTTSDFSDATDEELEARLAELAAEKAKKK